MLKVANSCKAWWRTMPQLYASTKNPDDVDTDQEDHTYDDTRYMCMTRPLRPKKISQVPVDSFMGVRNKHIRAKKYAARHGCSIEQAYNRVH